MREEQKKIKHLETVIKRKDEAFAARLEGIKDKARALELEKELLSGWLVTVIKLYGDPCEDGHSVTVPTKSVGSANGIKLKMDKSGGNYTLAVMDDAE